MRSAFVAVIFLTCVLAPQRSYSGTNDDNLTPDNWPTDVQLVVSDIISSMSEADKEVVRNTKVDDLIRFHMGWGTAIRNRYGLWRGNAKLLVSACGKPCHPDDASMIIIQSVWQELQNSKQPD